MSSRWIGLGLILVMTLFGIVVSSALPERMPIHWGLNGEVDGYGSRTVAVWLIPSIGLVVWLLFIFLPRIDPVPADRGASFRPTLGRYANALLLFLAVVHWVILGSALGWPVSVTRTIGLGVGLLFVALGSEMGRLGRNSIVGIRLPWTLADAEVWRESHRIGGRIMLISGVFIALGSLVLPPVGAVVTISLVITGMLIGMIGYSYWVAMKKRRTAASTDDILKNP